MLGELEFGIRIELADRSKMNITTDIAVSILKQSKREGGGGGKTLDRICAHLRIVTRIDLSAARSCKSSITSLRSSLWFLAVQWSSRSSKTSTPPSNLLNTLPNSPVFPRALIGSSNRDVRL